MKYLQYAEFRHRSRECFDSVERGESYIIIRKGRPVARLLPFQEQVQGWKRQPERVTLKRGKSTTEVLREERDAC